MPFPRARSAAWLWSLATVWTSTKASNICGVPAKALAALRGAKSPCERWFRLQSASNSPKTHVFGTMRSVSRRPITVAVFRRAVRHHRAPARRSTPSPTPAGCPTVAEASRPRIREWSPRPFTAASGPRPRIVRPFRPSTVPIAAASGWVAAESALERLQGLKHAHLGLNLLLHAPQTRSLQRSRTPRRGSGPSADRAGAGASKKVEARPQSPAKGPRRPQRATTRS